MHRLVVARSVTFAWFLIVLVAGVFLARPTMAGAVILFNPQSDGVAIPAPTRVGTIELLKAPVGLAGRSTTSQAGAQLAPAPQPSAAGSARVPILMYHHVRPINFATSDKFTADLTLPPDQLEQQLAYLKANGYTSISLRDLWSALQGGQQLPFRPVVLSFDDGYADNYEYAFPLLKKYGFQGTFFIITGMVGIPDHMSWDQVKELSAGGMEIGSHTITHPDLAKTAQSKLDQELVGSKKALEDALGVEVTALAYPSGSYNQTTVAAARKAGYQMAVTTKYGSLHVAAGTLELLRVRIHGTDTLPTFRAVIQQHTAR